MTPAQLAALSALLTAFNEPLPDGDCKKIERAINVLQAVYRDKCPIAES